MAGHSTETEIGGKEWKFAEVTVPHCHRANLCQESAFESGVPRKAGASGSTLYRHLANSLASRGNVTVEGSSKWRKINRHARLWGTTAQDQAIRLVRDWFRYATRSA